MFDPFISFTDNQVSLLYTPNSTGVAGALTRVASAAACGTGLGFYIDPGLPKILKACPASCATFSGGILTARVSCP